MLCGHLGQFLLMFKSLELKRTKSAKALLPRIGDKRGKEPPLLKGDRKFPKSKKPKKGPPSENVISTNLNKTDLYCLIFKLCIIVVQMHAVHCQTFSFLRSDNNWICCRRVLRFTRYTL